MCANLLSLLTVVVLALSLSLKLITCSTSETSQGYVNITKLYVMRENATSCPDWIEDGCECQTLSYYIQKVDQYFVSNTCMEFLEGVHVMEINRAIQMDKISNFSLVGTKNSVLAHTTSSDGSPEPTSRIECSGTIRSGFYFRNSFNILIENLAIGHCGLQLSRRVKVLAALAFDTVINVEIHGVRIYNSTGFGVHADRLLGNSTISDSAFVHNVGTNNFYGGNVRFWYQKCPRDVNTSLRIERSWFMHGYDVFKTEAFYPYASGLTLLIDCPFVHAVIDNITAMHNVADDGGNLAIRVNFAAYQPGIGSVLLQNSQILHGLGHRGGGLRVWSSIHGAKNISCSDLRKDYVTLRVINTDFVGNHANSAGGAFYISHYEEEHIDCFVRTIRFESCSIHNNSVPAPGNGAVTEIIKHKIPNIKAHTSPQFQVVFSNTQFVRNRIILDGRGLVDGSILAIFSVDKVTFESCTFSNNNSTALSTVDSNIVLSGQLLFSENKAVNGGAMKLCDSSYMYIKNNTLVTFERNYAKNAGGAIFAQQRCLETAPSCFFQPLVHDFTKLADFGTRINMSLQFFNNTAGSAGNTIYGGSTDYCYTFKRFIDNHGKKSFYFSFKVFNKLFNISNKDHHHDISSYPYGVCLCDNKTMKPQCEDKHLDLDPKYPGEVFQIMAVTVGQRRGFSPAIVNGRVLGDSKENALKQLTNVPLKQCAWLKYSLHTTNKSVTFNLTVQQANPDAYFYFRYHYPQVVVPLKPCPWGFSLQNDSDGMISCGCHSALKDRKIDCNLTAGLITRYKSNWVGFDSSKFNSFDEFQQKCQNLNFSSDRSCADVLVSSYCPYDYCNHSRVTIDASSVNKQCNFDRTGVLCGKCSVGHSATFGGSNCRGCSNDTIVPIVISFIVAGFILVFVLIILNLTVTEGTLNGLIFFMNFVQVNKSVYFPTYTGDLWYGVKMLTGVVAWFNLDLGITACFYSGMDTYVKTWLLFVFPIYIWLIVIIIIVLSRKSVLVQRLIGKNAVKILATLFLLSVAKLSRAIISVFSHITIEFPSGSGHYVNVWTPDGNVRFLTGKHIPLFIVGFFFLILILTYTFLVMFNMCLQRLPSKPLFSLVYRLKPFFDAYTGPFKTRCRFWTGLLLLIRCILFTLFSINAFNNPQLKLMLTTIMCVVLLSLMTSFNGVYRRLYLNILEMLAFCNLGILSSLSCFLDGSTKTVIVSSVSVLVACVTFIVVIFFHCYRQIRSSKILRKFLSSISRSPSREDLISSTLSEDVRKPTSLLTQTEVCIPPPEEAAAKELIQNMNSVVAAQDVPEVKRYTQYREPLLEDADSDS